MKKNPNILVIKLSAIGDVVHSLPFLEVLRDRFPLSTIDWLVEEDASDIVEDHPDIDQLIVFPRKDWLMRLLKNGECYSVGKDAVNFTKELRKKKYDIVIDLQGLFKSGILAFIVKGRKKIALNGGREGSSIFVNERVAILDPNIHALERYLYIARYLGAAEPSWNGQISINAKHKRYVDHLLEEIGNNRTLVAVNPMAKWETKLWSLDRFACLADRIKEELEAVVIFTGSIDDIKAVETILSNMNTHAINLAGKSSLKELAYLYRKCAVVIATDTGPMHIAAAMSVPTVIALFGPTSPFRTGPYGSKHKVINSNLACSPCFKKKCDDMSCMKEITVDMVFKEVKEALNV